MASVRRRLSTSLGEVGKSASLGEVRRRVHLDEEHVERHPWGGSIGRWIEDEWEYQKDMLSGIDNMWLLLDEDSDFNPVCASIFIFDRDVELDTLIARWSDMCDRFPAYRRRPSGLHRRFHTAVLADYNFDINEHFSVETLEDGKNGKRELEARMAEFIAKDWDLSKALWEVKVLRNYRDGTDAQCAIISRAHHTLADGQGFVMSQLTVTSARGAIEKQTADLKEHYAKLKHGDAKLSDIPKDPTASKQSKFLYYASYLDPIVPGDLVTLLFYSLQFLFAMVALLYAGFAGLRAGYYYLTFTRRALRYKGARPYAKEFSFSDAIAMEDIKTVQKAFSGIRRRITVNDVMCAVATRTIHEYCAKHGMKEDKRTALFIPLSIRTPEDPSMGNFSSGMIAYFPHHRARAPTQTLLASAHDEMQKLKTSYWPKITFTLLAWLYRSPVLFPPARSALIESMLTCVHGVLTNVPGPREGIDFEGARVVRWTASPPQAGKGTLGLGVISYDGMMVFTVTADRTKEYAGVASELTEGFVRTFKEFLEDAKSKVNA